MSRNPPTSASNATRVSTAQTSSLPAASAARSATPVPLMLHDHGRTDRSTLKLLNG
ncbi:hypothetical protein QJS04_geneDACA025043 [Acorus gramineus]|uniref:Uncharacterized protein n=1 Tax=Acorus gramineus TaxID=55184 RepID=A0AAV9A155_ACOGR|nr:hypothetical protein QJS04_geneDACA025043 [Acorus gramineus]